MIYLADQIFILGPTYMHLMCPYEHHMVVMKGYLRNHAHAEGSMIEGYTGGYRMLCRLYERWKPNRCHSFMTPWSTILERNQST
jgi:hypothetical protein